MDQQQNMKQQYTKVSVIFRPCGKKISFLYDLLSVILNVFSFAAKNCENVEDDIHQTSQECPLGRGDSCRFVQIRLIGD